MEPKDDIAKLVVFGIVEQLSEREERVHQAVVDQMFDSPEEVVLLIHVNSSTATKCDRSNGRVHRRPPDTPSGPRRR